MKKCLIVSTVSRQFTLFERGNIEVLKKLGYEVHCVANYSDATEELKELEIIEHNIDIQRSPFSLKNIKAYKQLKNIINSDKYDLIHCHSPMGGVLARLTAKRTRKINHTRVIYTAHGFHFFRGAPIINWILYYPIEKWLSKYTDCLITINQEDYDIAKKKFRSKEVELVNGIGVDKHKFDFEMSEKEKHELRESLGLKDDDFVLIQVGELNKNKNQIMAIKAMKELVKENSKIHLLIVGKGELENYYKGKIQEYNLEQNIHMLGYRNDIPKLMKISDVLLSLSYREGLPVNVIEGMFCGLPIIATDCRGNRDLIEIGKNGYIVNIGDVTDLISKIMLEMKNKSEIKNDLQKYTNTTIKAKMEEIYLKVLRKKVVILRSTSIKNDSRVLKESTALSKFGYNVKILGWNRDGFLSGTYDKIILEKNIIPIIAFQKKSKYGSGIKSIFKLTKFQLWLLYQLLKQRKEIDIIHCCDFDTAIPARIISKMYNKKLVYDIFDYYIDSHYVPNKLKKIVEKAEIKIINNADLTIICTEQRKEQISKANPKKCIVIYNTPDIEIYNLDKRIIKSNNKKTKLVYVGILQEGRLLKEIGSMMEEHPEIELHIGGFGTYEEYFEGLSKKCSNVFYYGKMDYEDVLCLEMDCDILFATYNPLIENHKYSAPNKVYEAMVLGKPIIVCKDTGVDQMVKAENIGYCIQYNVKDFFEIINKEAYNFEKFNRNINNKKYLWKSMKERLLEEYRLL